ncbi:Similar to Atf2: Cyclic AMP-dependent transcription factor ATF-2 (Rattus norvegicus) [Cotesia congregata]|uniref:Similar to Atf2: Cyclic AMP-dependent transcription factor ATF-2 (Rattus norvegicus) n=1 Tax=Cotesia congregata TaxID=51543 RepID=A0A8J2MU68_COTCN|nr:Similar to Atf2: Cyclic AMP-dependent transcription factor ATF-2 (Rattus norvegicus) [Cotesia congregata]
MTDTEKPFACSSPGCNMSFVNEDHLVVHKKKHDMILNFGTGGKSNSFIADQTPTPTRFIRNCEEVGLFQDLQNVNPFEETFRRAIIINDDTLHTPHVFPHIEDNSSNKIVLHRADDNEIDETLQGKSKDINVEKPNCESLDIVVCKEVKKTSETIVIQEADTSIIQQSPQLPSSTSLSINGEEVQFLLKTQDGKFMQLSATPMIDSTIPAISVQSQPTKPQTIVIDTALPLINNELDKSVKKSSSPLLDAKQRLREALIKNGNVTSSEVIKNDKVQNKNTEKKFLIKKKVEVVNENTVDLRRKQDVQARNRASSMRARAKRKQWINQLQQSLDESNKVNAKLQLEIKNLRLEISNLKTVLLAHKDCSVTKEMAKNKIIIDPEVISLTSVRLPEKAAVLPIDITQGIKRESAHQDVIYAGNKKVKTKRQSIILPKTDDKMVPMVAKVAKVICGPCNNLKLVNLNQIVEEKCIEKPILIVQNGPPRKVQIINSRQIVQVDQSLQLINVASKTTGT